MSLRVILITGANGGLGQAIARAFLQESSANVVWLGVRSNRDLKFPLSLGMRSELSLWLRPTRPAANRRAKTRRASGWPVRCAGAITRRERAGERNGNPLQENQGSPDCQIAHGASNFAGIGVNPLWKPANHF